MKRNGAMHPDADIVGWVSCFNGLKSLTKHRLIAAHVEEAEKDLLDTEPTLTLAWPLVDSPGQCLFPRL